MSMEDPAALKAELERLRARYDRLQALHDVGTVIHSTLDAQEALRLIIREAVTLMRASSGSVVLINPTTGFLEILAAEGLPANAGQLQLRLGEGITGWVARTGKPARVDEVSSDPRYIMLRPEVRSELAVPLEVEGEVRGVLNVDSDRSHAFSAEDADVLQSLSRQAARVIHHTWLYEQLRLKVRLFESLASVSQTINSSLNLDDALSVITREACVLMGAKMCSIMLLDDTGSWLDLRASYGAGSAYLSGPRLHVQESFCGTVLRRKKPMQLENVQISSRYQKIEVAAQEGLVALLAMPLIDSGQAIGVLNVYRGEPYVFPNEEVRVLSALTELSATAIEKARLYERVVDVEEQLRRNEQLSALGLLAAEVAHEIRNPLTVMKMLYHSLNLDFPPDDPRSRDARVIQEKMDHLNRIVEQILDFARRSDPHVSPVRMNHVIEELRLLVRHKLKQQAVELVLQLAPDLPPLEGDRAQLEQALLNLILNAAQAMPEGGRLVISSRSIRIPRRSAAPTHVAIEIIDTGHGLSEEQRLRAFSSVLTTTKKGGTGLGLAIVGRVIQAHHGKVRIKSTLGKGTTVEIVLPVSQPTPPPELSNPRQFPRG